MATRPLTETTIKALKARASSYKVSDGGGLHLLVSPSGSKTWRLAYRFEGRQRCLTLGLYPALTLGKARKERELAKDKLREGQDPGAEDSDAPASLTFEDAARAWHAAQESRLTQSYARQVFKRIEADLFPDIGDLPIKNISRTQVLAALRKVEERGTLETARRLRQYAGAIFRFAGAAHDDVSDPTPMLRGALKSPPRSRHHAALKRQDVGPFLQALDRYEGETTTRLAIALALHTVVRTGELIGARWDEFEALDDDAVALWRVPADRMKARREHLVPITAQAATLLRDLHEISGESAYLFPAADGRNGHISNNTMLFATYRMGFRGRMTIHGFRRTFSTEANEHGWPADHVEMQLAHDERNAVRAAYNAAQYLPGRRELMRWWSERLAKLRSDPSEATR
jgi:integrase